MSTDQEGTQLIEPTASSNEANGDARPAGRATPPEPAVAAEDGRPALVKAVRGAGSWFFWLAGLSLVNSIILYAGGEWSFLFGLGVTQLVDAVVLGVGDGTAALAPAAIVTGLVLNVFTAGVYMTFGVQATRGRVWAFAVGGLAYLFDAVLVLMFGDFLALAFHAWVLYSLWRGLRAARALANP